MTAGRGAVSVPADKKGETVIWVETIDIIIRIVKSGNQDMIEYAHEVVRSVYDTMLEKGMPESADGTGCGHNSCKIIPFPIPKKRRAGRERIR